MSTNIVHVLVVICFRYPTGFGGNATETVSNTGTGGSFTYDDYKDMYSGGSTTKTHPGIAPHIAVTSSNDYKVLYHYIHCLPRLLFIAWLYD